MNPEENQTNRNTVSEPINRVEQTTSNTQQVVESSTNDEAGQTAIENGSDKTSAKFMIMVAIFIAIIVAVVVSLIIVFKEPDPVPVPPSTDSLLKDDANKLGLAIINFHNGNNFFEITPLKVSQLKTGYIPKDFNDPRTNQPYSITTAIPKVGELQYIIGGACRSDDSIEQTSDNANFAIRVLLDNETLYCLSKPEVKQISQ